MSKKSKKKAKRSSDNGRKEASGKKKHTIKVIIGIAAIVLAVMVISGNNPFSSTPDKKGKSFYVQGGESRPVLDPAMFTGYTRMAYAAAAQYPEVLDEVYCYCECDNPPFNHKSLLSCFTERHGAG
jgi:hypothetical protein